MKLLRCVATLSLSLAGFTLSAEPIPAESRITDVTVYSDRAQVTRTADVPLAAGETRIVLGNLPAALADDSVRATGRAATAVSIEDVEVRRIVRPQIDDQAAAEFERQLQKLRDDNAALDARQRVLDQQRSLLSQIQIKAAGEISRDIQINKFDIAQLKDLPGTLGAALSRLEDESQRIVVERRELQPKIQAAEAEFNKHQAAARRVSKSVVVTVNAKEATKLQLQVSYVLGGALWLPSYDARAAVDSGKVEFTYNGIVRQQTGEDWRGVNLTLSTARPAIGAQMPELTKWTVDFLQVFVQAAAPALEGGMGRPFARKKAAEEQGEPNSLSAAAALPAQAPAMPQQAEIEQGVTSATFHVPRAADVPSDGEPHRQTIAVESLPAIFEYETTPKLNALAYLKGTATNSTDAPFLAGTVNVFVRSDFIGTGRIDTVAPTEAVKLYLGTDDAIRVKREELKDRRGKSGLFNRRRKQVYAYKITIENFKDKPQQVRVFEQLPVSANDDIKVTLSDNSTKPSQHDAAIGKLTWEMILKPHEKREIVYEFTVDWPQDKQVAGL
ncbi:MAG: mucoidy inhibitor MuiA family protein [Verrucomicrobiia bacterium]|jgi:uncharacterized protein (TIGR02231 family)